jgi:hypothetical protein
MTTQSDPFAAYRIKKGQFMKEPEVKKDESDPFSTYRIKKSEEIPETYELGRHAARIGSRIAETIGGIPGDVSSLLQSGMIYGLEKFSGRKAPESVYEEAKKSRFFPTSSELKEFSEEKTKGFTKAQSPAEEKGDEIAQTLASLVGPMKFRKALGITVGSQLAKEGLGAVGFGEGAQEAGKLGTMFILSALNPGAALKYSRLNYDKANQLAKGASINVSNLENNLNKLKISLEEGLTTSEKEFVRKPIDQILGKVKNGKLPVTELTSMKRDVNKLVGDPETLKGAKKLLRTVGKEVDLAIKPYEKINPEFAKTYRPANEIFGAVMQGNKAQNWIKKTLGNKSILGSVAVELLLGYPQAIVPTIATGAGVYGAAKSIDFLTRLSKSKELQKFYSKALLSAAKEDLPSIRLYEKKIEDYLKDNPRSQTHH